MRPSLTQILGYGALAVAVLVIGARWVGAGQEQAGAAPVEVGGKLGPRADGGGRTGLVIHVAGAVSRPGVYQLPAGSRVADAVKQAGGPTRSGEVNAVNLAAPLADGQQVVIPGPGAASGVAAEGPISLGSATVTDLDQIDSIGPVTAANILEFRDAGNPISRVEDLDAVPGIGPATIEALRSRLQP